MENVIVSVLKETGRVIIPDFGAFIVKTKSPLKVIFNEFLQYNDGALIGATASKFNIAREEAANKVKELVNFWSASLNKGESINIPEIGTLSKSATGKIALGEIGEAKGKDSSAKKEDSATVEFDLTEEKKAETKTPPPSAAKKTEKKPIAKKEVKPAQPVTKKTSPSSTSSEAPAKPIVKKEPTKTVEKKTESFESKPIANYYENDSNRRLKLILWIVLLVIVNGAIIGFFLYREEITAFFGKKKPVPNEQQIKTPTITDETVVEKDTAKIEVVPIVSSEPQEELIEEEVPEKLITGKKYFVVAGVFANESNADKLVIELNKKGYNAEKFGKIGALHAVSYDVFKTKQEADRLMLKIKKELNSGAWIRVVD